MERLLNCTFLLQILIIQFAGAFFDTIPLDMVMWLKLFAVSVSVVVLSEIVKLIWRSVNAGK